MRTFAELWPALLGMALVTYATRVGGLSIVTIAAGTPQLARTLQHLATGVLTALVVAGLFEGDGAVAGGAAAAMLVMRSTGRLLGAIGAAALAAAAVRALLAW